MRGTGRREKRQINKRPMKKNVVHIQVARSGGRNTGVHVPDASDEQLAAVEEVVYFLSFGVWPA